MSSRNSGPMRRRTIHRYHRNHGERSMAVPGQNGSDPLSSLMADFLAELVHANRSRHTCRAYATDLAQFAAFYRGSVGGITAEVIRSFGATLEQLCPASRARKQAALASF